LGCDTSETQAERAASETLLHEFGHCDTAFRIRDEYFPTYGCGHSVMGPPEAYEANVTDFCTAYNGGQDHGSGHASSENNWACFAPKLYGSLPVVPTVPTTYTPDAFYKVDGAASADFGSAVTFDETVY
jgi:hypothetical protein